MLAVLESKTIGVTVAVNPILSKLNGYKDMFKITDEFAFRPATTTHMGVSCP